MYLPAPMQVETAMAHRPTVCVWDGPEAVGFAMVITFMPNLVAQTEAMMIGLIRVGCFAAMQHRCTVLKIDRFY